MWKIFVESWFWEMAQFFAIAISLGLIYRQIRLQRQANLLQTLASLDERWNSQEMCKSRKEACTTYLDGKFKISRMQGDVLTFFEDIGIYLERGVFDIESIWDKYGYYIEHYWAIYRPHIDEFRAETKDNTWYEKFEYLKNKMEEHSRKRGVAITVKTQDEIKKFMTGECDYIA
jgi:hypothetical protein